MLWSSTYPITQKLFLGDVFMNKDYELERLGNEIDCAQNEINIAKSKLDYIATRRDPIKSQLESSKYRIDELKRYVSSEYEAMRYCYQCHDKISAENHRYNAQSYKDSLQREYEIKNSYYTELNGFKTDYENALYQLRTAKEKKQQLLSSFKSRLEFLKSEHRAEQEKWREKPCKLCGSSIRYRIDWDHIPNVCKRCKSK